MPLKRCLNCGKKFVPRNQRHRCCCRDCYNAFRRKESQERAADRVNVSDYLISDYDGLLREATEQPRWCSDARWRMELSRRKRPRYFDSIPENPIDI
jgi:predicted  nucleic acid-binding Zn-ribbon protein